MRSQQKNNSISPTPQTAGIQLRAAQPTETEPFRPPAYQLKAPTTELPGDSVLQEKGENTDAPTVSSPIQRPNKTGLPDDLKAGIENLSGYSMDDVKVHYNSSKPAQLQALAITQGTEIHVRSGQEKHLAHEAWHVVQQKQGRVKPPTQLTGGKPVKVDEGLEEEAEVMGRRATGVEKAGEPRKTPKASHPKPPMQLQEDLAERIRRVLRNYHNIHDVTDQEAEDYAQQLRNTPGTRVPVRRHNQALTMDVRGIVRAVEYRPPANASNMRLSGVEGPMTQEEATMVTVGQPPLTWVGHEMSVEEEITRQVLRNVGQRGQQNTVMGGSAAALTGVEHAEWLHGIGHQLGGTEDETNLMAGPHQLNTAMIPFENAVSRLSLAGIPVRYGVRFLGNERGNQGFVQHVELTFTADEYNQIITLSLPSGSEQYMNVHLFPQIQERANQLEREIIEAHARRSSRGNQTDRQ